MSKKSIDLATSGLNTIPDPEMQDTNLATDSPTDASPAQSQAAVEALTDANPNPQPLADPSPAPTEQAASMPVAPAPPVTAPVTDLDAFLSSLSPEQLAKVRARAITEGFTPSPMQRSLGAVHADGSMTISIHLEPQIVEQLLLWADSDGVDVGEEAKIRINEALTNYLYGDWSAMMAKPAEPPPVSTPAPVPVAAK
jgi:hypothetical protein